MPSCLFILLLSCAIVAQVPSPRSVLGFQPTDDRTIADWNQISDYFARLDKASKNVAVREIGKSTLGRPLIVVFISSSDNIKNLEKYAGTIEMVILPPIEIDGRDVDELLYQARLAIARELMASSASAMAKQQAPGPE